MTDQPGDPVQPKQWPLSWRWVVALLVLLAIFVGLRGLRALQPGPVVAAMPTGTVVVVGVTDRSSLTGSDRVLIDSHSSTVQFAAVSVRPRYIGDCAAAGWATLGAGRRTSVNGLCHPRVERQQITDWPQRLAAAAARHGDAALGTLALSIPGCVAAVGPRAALAAARQGRNRCPVRHRRSLSRRRPGDTLPTDTDRCRPTVQPHHPRTG